MSITYKKIIINIKVCKVLYLLCMCVCVHACVFMCWCWCWRSLLEYVACNAKYSNVRSLLFYLIWFVYFHLGPSDVLFIQSIHCCDLWGAPQSICVFFLSICFCSLLNFRAVNLISQCFVVRVFCA